MFVLWCRCMIWCWFVLGWMCVECVCDLLELLFDGWLVIVVVLLFLWRGNGVFVWCLDWYWMGCDVFIKREVYVVFGCWWMWFVLIVVKWLKVLRCVFVCWGMMMNFFVCLFEFCRFIFEWFYVFLNFFFKVFFNFFLWYLFVIGFVVIFSFRWSLLFI